MSLRARGLSSRVLLLVLQHHASGGGGQHEMPFAGSADWLGATVDTGSRKAVHSSSIPTGPKSHARREAGSRMLSREEVMNLATRTVFLSCYITPLVRLPRFPIVPNP